MIPKILAPAGDWPALDAAIQAGADAIYLGLHGMNMRAGVRNFSDEEFSEICNICHKRGVGVHLTMNTLCHEEELDLAFQRLDHAKQCGVDAVICWDLAIVAKCHELGLPAFLSTQASVSNSQAILAYYRHFGIRHFVLARECSLEQIAAIRANLTAALPSESAREIALEIFVHGAMCVAQSGRCFLSHFQCGKSANRGECLQPCRREYRIIEEENAENSFVVGKDYIISPQDLCTIPFIEKIFETGLDILKIEGRAKNPEYVFATVSAYRSLRDYYFAHRHQEAFTENFAIEKARALTLVQTVFHRDFSPGFYLGKPLDQWQAHGNQATTKKSILGRVENFYSKISCAEIRLTNGNLSIGDELQIEGNKTGFLRFTVSSMQENGHPVTTMPRGSRAAVLSPAQTRRGDQVYIVK